MVSTRQRSLDKCPAPVDHVSRTGSPHRMSPPASIEDPKAPLFQSVDRTDRLSGRRLGRRAVLAMIKRRAAGAGLPASTCCHTFRATGITAHLGYRQHSCRVEGRRVTGRTQVAHPALSQPGRSPKPLGAFPPPALRTRRAAFRHRALQWNHAARTRVPGRGERVGLASRGTRLAPVRRPAGASSGLLTPWRRRPLWSSPSLVHVMTSGIFCSSPG